MPTACCVDLRVEHLVNPISLPALRPRFSWVIDADAPDVVQEAYELELCRTAPGVEEFVWSSGRVASSQSVLVDYGGRPLESLAAYRWRVRVWIAGSQAPTGWRESIFETAPVTHDWIASWIEPSQRSTAVERWTLFDGIRRGTENAPVETRLRPAQLIRQEFSLDRAVRRARLYVTAHGIYQAEVNGRPIGDELFAPGFDSYERVLSVQAYNVGGLLETGDNAMGLTLADGWWAGRIGLTGSSAQWGDRTSAIWQLHVEYEDGGGTVIGSSGAACSHDAPMRYADLFIGEWFDRGATIEGWSEPGFDDAGWHAATVLDDGQDALVGFVGEPVRRLAELEPTSIRGAAETGFVVDFGQVIAGRVRLTIPRGEPGRKVTIEHTESLDRDGSWFVNIAGINKDQTDVYVAAGHPDGEVYEPTFTFHGFRYIRIHGLETAPKPDQLRAIVIGTDLNQTGAFRSSDVRLNRLHENVAWSQRANFLSIPTDCPQRERAGWTGDIQVFAPAATGNMRVAAFLTRWLHNLRSDQLPDGQVPIISPWSPLDRENSAKGEGFGRISAAGWSDAIAIVPWVLYERYGDRRVLEENYDAMRRWVDFQTTTAATGLPSSVVEAELSPRSRANQSLLWNTGDHFGDWLTPSTLRGGPLHETITIAPTLTGELIAPMFQANTLALLARIAEVLGHDDEAADYVRRAAAVRAAFAEEYVLPDGRLPVELQGPYALALAFDMAPDAMRPLLAARLAALVEDNGDRLDTGFLSVPYLLDVLWDAGYRDLARRILWQSESPSWLYEVDHGATTIWESWDAVASDGAVGEVSLNHYAFGCVDDWLFRRVAGIQPASPGYRSIRIEPDFEAGVDEVDARIDTPYGPVELGWVRRGTEVRLHARIPANTRAELVLAGSTEVVGSGTVERRLRLDISPAPADELTAPA